MENISPAVLLEQCLNNVWNEKDAGTRESWLNRVYHERVRLYEPDREEAIEGIGAIAATVTKVMGGFPEDFRFVVQGSPSGHHGIGVARWHGESQGKVLLTGSDAIKVENGLIVEQYIFIDPAL